MITATASITKQVSATASLKRISVNAADVTIQNSDDTYDETQAPGTTHELPDVDHTDSDGSSSVLPGMTAMVCTPVATPSGIEYRRSMLTGQMFTFNTGDDGDNFANGVYDYTPPALPVSCARLDTAAGSPLTTLVDDNAFGNKNRFTDSVGAQNYDGTGGSLVDYVIDHLTGEGRPTNFSSTATFTAAQDAATASSLNGFSDWRVQNRNEALSILDLDTNIGYNYAPFNLASGAIWTCSSRLDSGASAANGFFLTTTSGISSSQNKATSREYLMIRNHYV